MKIIIKDANGQIAVNIEAENETGVSKSQVWATLSLALASMVAEDARKKDMPPALKKLMIDRKIPRYMRNAMAVIADKNGVIAVQDIGADCSRTAKNNANTLQITVKGLSKNGL